MWQTHIFVANSKQCVEFSRVTNKPEKTQQSVLHILSYLTRLQYFPLVQSKNREKLSLNNCSLVLKSVTFRTEIRHKSLNFFLKNDVYFFYFSTITAYFFNKHCNWLKNQSCVNKSDTGAFTLHNFNPHELYNTSIIIIFIIIIVSYSLISELHVQPVGGVVAPLLVHCNTLQSDQTFN